MAGCLRPPLRSHSRQTGSVTASAMVLVAAGAAGVGQQRVTAVEQPQLALLERPDVVDEPGAGGLPGRAASGEVAADSTHSVNGSVTTGAASVRPGEFGRGLDVVPGGRRGDPVDHRGDEGDVVVDPVGQLGVQQRGEVATTRA